MNEVRTSSDELVAEGGLVGGVDDLVVSLGLVRIVVEERHDDDGFVGRKVRELKG
jgi:hypothetical protein